MRSLLLAFVCTLLLTTTASGAGPVLLAPFVHGTDRAELEKIPGAEPGEGRFSGDILLPEHSYAGLDWNVRLEMRGDTLVRVSLMERYSKERMSRVLEQLRTDKFEMLAVKVDDKELDLFGALRFNDPQTVTRKMLDMVQNVRSRATYAWFDAKAISPEIRKNAKGLNEMLMAVPSDTREAEVTLLANAEGGNPSILLVDFLFPVLNAQR